MFRAPTSAEVGREPVERATPTVGRRLRVVAGARVAVEAVLGVGIAHDLGGYRGVAERSAQLLDALDRDALVEITEQAEPWCLQCRRLTDQRRERQPAGGGDATAVEPDRGAQSTARGHQ